MPRINPPAPGITGDVYRYTVFCRYNNTVSMNLFDYMSASFASNPATDMNALLIAMNTNCLASFQSCISSSGEIFQTSIACVSSLIPPTLIQPLSLAGTVTDPPLPAEVAAVAIRRSALKGQHGRGRVSMPAIPTSFTVPATDPNLLTSAAVTTYDTLLTDMLRVLTGGSTSVRHVISTRPVAPLSTVIKAAVVTSFLMDDVLGTIRRRKPGRGI